MLGWHPRSAGTLRLLTIVLFATLFSTASSFPSSTYSAATPAPRGKLTRPTQWNAFNNATVEGPIPTYIQDLKITSVFIQTEAPLDLFNYVCSLERAVNYQVQNNTCDVSSRPAETTASVDATVTAPVVATTPATTGSVTGTPATARARVYALLVTRGRILDAVLRAIDSLDLKGVFGWHASRTGPSPSTSLIHSPIRIQPTCGVEPTCSTDPSVDEWVCGYRILNETCGLYPPAPEPATIVDFGGLTLDSVLPPFSAPLERPPVLVSDAFKLILGGPRHPRYENVIPSFLLWIFLIRRAIVHRRSQRSKAAPVPGRRILSRKEHFKLGEEVRSICYVYFRVACSNPFDLSID